MKYVIIGNSAAATGAIEGIRSIDQEGEIILVGTEQRPVYGRPLISYYLAGKVDEDHMYFRPPGFYEDNKVCAILGQKVSRIIPEKKQVYIEPSEDRIDYDRLLITTGGHPVRPACFTGNYDNMFNFYTWDDVQAIEERLLSIPEGSRAIVVGAGLIGLKAAEALIKRHYQVTVVEAAGQILPSILTQSAAGRVQAYLESAGIRFCLNNPVQLISGRSSVERAVLVDGSELECELLITAVGVKPEIAFLASSGIEVKQGVLTDQHLQSSLPDIYAAGDVAEAFDAFAGLHRVVPVWPFAFRQGQVAGVNMAGGSVEWAGGPVFNSLPLLELTIATGGISNIESGDVQVIEASKGNYLYRQLILQDNRLTGFVLLGDVSSAGVYRHLIESRMDVSSFINRLAAFDFGIIDLPGAVQKVSREGGY